MTRARQAGPRTKDGDGNEQAKPQASRRQLLGLGAGAVAAGALALGAIRPDSAEAGVDGDLVLGADNTSSATTVLRGTGMTISKTLVVMGPAVALVAEADKLGIHGLGPTGVLGQSDVVNGYGVAGKVTQPGGIGVKGYVNEGGTGVRGATGAGHELVAGERAGVLGVSTEDNVPAVSGFATGVAAGVHGQSDSAAGVWGSSKGTGAGVNGENYGPGPGVFGKAANGPGVLAGSGYEDPVTHAPGVGLQVVGKAVLSSTRRLQITVAARPRPSQWTVSDLHATAGSNVFVTFLTDPGSVSVRWVEVSAGQFVLHFSGALPMGVHRLAYLIVEPG